MGANSFQHVVPIVLEPVGSDDVLRLQAGGVRAILVGETLMRAPDVGAKLDELRGVAG